MLRLLALLATLAAGPARAEGLAAPDPAGPVAFLGLSFIDTSTKGAYFGERADESARLALLEDEIARRFRSEGFALADLTPAAAEIESTANPARCYGCEVRIARKLDASLVLVGEVQKVSNLILSMNLVLRRVPDGQIVRARAVDIRSNTDASWLRGIRYIMDNHFFGKE